MNLSKPKNAEPLALIGIFTILMVYLHISGTDNWIAGHFFSNGHWIYRDNFFLEKILHKGGVLFTMLALIGLIVYRFKVREEMTKHYLNVVLISTITSILVVYALKLLTTFPCPWNSQVFGGGQPVFSYAQLFSFQYPKGHCFPAGHSSGGYAFLSMYFAHNFIYKKKSLLTLLPGLLLGVIFGLTQQLRGAHYLSHDFGTIIISIFISWITSWCYYSYNNKNET